MKPLIRRIIKLKTRNRNAETHCLTISGMSCRKCSNKISAAVLSIDGVSDVTIDLAAKTATIEGAADITKVRDAIVKAGYGVTEFT